MKRVAWVKLRPASTMTASGHRPEGCPGRVGDLPDYVRAVCYHSLDLAEVRLWWPVYLAAHRDPDLGDFASLRHYHLATNRVPVSTVRRFGREHPRTLLDLYGISDRAPAWDSTEPRRTALAESDIRRLLAGFAVLAHDVERVDLARPAPILAEPSAPLVDRATRLRMLRTWARDRGISKANP